MTESDGWTATIRARRSSPEAGERLERTLAPEAAREVPRAKARMTRPQPDTVELEVVTRDTGALRAALQTYLGWIQLVDATEAAIAPDEPR